MKSQRNTDFGQDYANFRRRLDPSPVDSCVFIVVFEEHAATIVDGCHGRK